MPEKTRKPAETMKAKPESLWTDKKPPLRSRNGQKRDKVIQVRVSQPEFRKIKAAHGRSAAAVARLFLCGHAVPKQSVLVDAEKLALTHALHALFVAVEQTLAMARKRNDASLLSHLDTVKQALTHLLRVCFSNISR